MSTFHPSIDQYRIPLSEQDLPNSVLSRLVSYNISDVERFLNLATAEFRVLQKMLGVSSAELEGYVSHVRSNHPEVSGQGVEASTTWKVPPFGASAPDLDTYEAWVKQSMEEYNRANRSQNHP